MAIKTEFVPTGYPAQLPETPESVSLQRLVDDGAVYTPQVLNRTQFATLHAVLDRMAPQREPDPTPLAVRFDSSLAGGAASSFDHQLGLDELDAIARVRTGYAFADLTAEVQDAMLGLVAGGDITTCKLDLSRWLSGLRTVAV